MTEVLGCTHEVDTILHTRDRFDDGVDETGVRGEEQRHHGDQDNRRNKVRDVGQRLRELLEEHVVDVVQHDSQDDGHRETDDQLVEADDQRVPDQPAEQGGFKECGEPPGTDPW